MSSDPAAPSDKERKHAVAVPPPQSDPLTQLDSRLFALIGLNHRANLSAAPAMKPVSSSSSSSYTPYQPSTEPSDSKGLSQEDEDTKDESVELQKQAQQLLLPPLPARFGGAAPGIDFRGITTVLQYQDKKDYWKKKEGEELAKKQRQKDAFGNNAKLLYGFLSSLAGFMNVSNLNDIWNDPTADTLHNSMLSDLGDIELQFDKAWPKYVTSAYRARIEECLQWIRINCISIGPSTTQVSLLKVVKNEQAKVLFAKLMQTQQTYKNMTMNMTWARERVHDQIQFDFKGLRVGFDAILSEIT